jgi:anti-sigma factor ChrR (cupin superfamily)
MNSNQIRLNGDFGARVVLKPDESAWASSPVHGVDRRMLDRMGGDAVRATSIVRYRADSHFPEHAHPGGEEILVLEGVFSDDTGDYRTGTYLRNPIGSRHAPHSKDGCVLFVKLHQFERGDDRRIVVDTASGAWRPGLVDGLEVMPLHAFGTEHTALVRWAPGTRFQRHTHFGGEEILVIEGVFEDEHGAYPAGTWIRSPHLSAHAPYSSRGCVILVKTGHLSDERVAAWG